MEELAKWGRRTNGETAHGAGKQWSYVTSRVMPILSDILLRFFSVEVQEKICEERG